MKLRIKGNSIRLRLGQTEVAEFGEKGVCTDETTFLNAKFIYQLQIADFDELKAHFENSTLSVQVPRQLANTWVKDQSQVGFNYSQKVGNGQELSILVEKDFQCLAVRPNEDESDNFPNPMADEMKC